MANRSRDLSSGNQCVSRGLSYGSFEVYRVLSMMLMLFVPNVFVPHASCPYRRSRRKRLPRR